MRRPNPERTLVLMIAIAIVVGAGVDFAVDDVPAGTVDPLVRAEAPFESRAVFCPPPFSRSRSSSAVAAVSDPGTEVTVGVAPTDDENFRLPADRMLLRRVEGPPIDLVGYGARVHAGALLSAEAPAQGADAARCARISSDKWYFGEGTSALGYDERLLIRNPFPEEAVVSVSFYTPDGRTTRANLSELAVPSGDARYVRINDFILRQPVLGALVQAERGRVIAWKALFATPDDRPAGIQFTLGATEPATEWYFPEGAVGTGLIEELSLINPNRREAIVDVALLTPTQTVHPPKLVSVRIAPESLKELSLPDLLGGRDQDLGAIGAVVRSTNGTAIVAERTVWYAAGRTGVASEIGAHETFESWIVPPAAITSVDDSLVVINPGSARARASVTLIRQDGGPVTPARLQNVRVRAGTRTRMVLNDFTGGTPVMALVTATEPIVAERVATTGTGDVSAVMGFGITRTGR